LENRKKNVIIILSSLKEKGGYNITVGLGFMLPVSYWFSLTKGGL